jgi:hypothetical protein
MMQFNGVSTERIEEAKLPRRDWFLLPLISLSTICLLAVCTEVTLRRLVPAEQSTLPSCMIVDDATTGVRGRPDSVCTGDQFESGHVEYKFNGSGHRAGFELGPKTAGTFRIVLAGTSTPFGDYVRQEKTIAALLPAELSARTGRKVEVYNEAMLFESPRVINLRFNDFLNAKPDLILWILTPWDIEYESLTTLSRAPSPAPKVDIETKLWHSLLNTQTANVLLYLFYKSPDSFMKENLIGIGNTGTVDKNHDSFWQQHLQDFDRDTAMIEKRAAEAGVPLVVMMLPSRTQATMLSLGRWPAAFDPYKLNNDVQAIVVNHGGTYIDMFPYFHDIPHAEQYYFEMARHPNDSGNAVFSKLIANEFSNGRVHILNANGQPENEIGLRR